MVSQAARERAIDSGEEDKGLVRGVDDATEAGPGANQQEAISGIWMSKMHGVLSRLHVRPSTILLL